MKPSAIVIAFFLGFAVVKFHALSVKLVGYIITLKRHVTVFIEFCVLTVFLTIRVFALNLDLFVFIKFSMSPVQHILSIVRL